MVYVRVSLSLPIVTEKEWVKVRVHVSMGVCVRVGVYLCVCVCVGKSVRFNTQLRWDKHYQNKWLWMSLWNRWMGILGGSKVGRDKTLRLRWLCQYFFMTGRIFVDWKLPEEPNHGLVVRAVTCRARGPRFSPKCYFSLRGAAGCGAVGRAVVSDTRDPWFESRLRESNISNVYLSIAIQKRQKYNYP